MTINNFEKYIDPIILERGEDYYFNDFVINIEKITPDKWKTKVEGTEIYNIEIILKDNEIIETYCDCPYDMGEFCKHQVASFYKLRDCLSENNITIKNVSNNKLSREERLDQILSTVNKDDFIEFIKEKALMDDILYSNIISIFGIDINSTDKSEYYNIIKRYLNNAMDRHGFINYYQVSKSIEGAGIILSQAREAIDNENYTVAIAMAQSVVEIMIPALQYADSDGTFGMVIEEGFDILYECSQSNLNEKIRKEFFEYSLNEMSKKKYDGWADWQLDFLCIAKNLAKEKIELDMIVNITDNYNYEKSEYFIEKLLLIKYDILIKSRDSKEAEKFFQNNLHWPDFRKIAIENALSKNYFKKAEKLAFEGEEINKDLPGIVNKWKEYRLRIYKDTKNINNLRKLLKEFALDENFNYYLELKNTYNQNEWKNIYHEIIDKIQKSNTHYASSFLMRIYVEENLLEELLDEIKKEPYYITKYDKLLIKNFPIDVYDLYKKYLMDRVKHANKRSNYQEICNIIRRLIKINGNKIASEIINYLKVEYRNRPAFMDEISKIKLK